MFINIKDAIKEYLYWKSSYLLTASNRYENRLRHFETFVGSTKSISDITINDVIAFHKFMEKECNYSLATVAYSARIIRNLFEFWSGRGIECLNPKEIREVKYISPDKVLVSEQEFELMNEVLNESFYEDLIRKLAINILWDTGIRVSELCDMNISDIEETKELGLRCARIRRRKSLRYNTIVWGNETNKLLNQYLGLRLSINVQSDALFVARNNSRSVRITSRTIQRWVNELLNQTMIDKAITPHSFRHSKANRILNKSGNVRDVQAILGHVSPISSFSYLNVNRENHINLSKQYLQ